jgi:uncharacterized protein DUF2513
VIRDMDLIRKMVLAIEDAPTGFAPRKLSIEGYTPDQIGYHAYLMIDAGLALGTRVDHQGSTGPNAMLKNLTWAGHEFADAARDQTRWNKAMGIVKEKSGSVTLTVLTELLKSLMKGALNLP